MFENGSNGSIVLVRGITTNDSLLKVALPIIAFESDFVSRRC